MRVRWFVAALVAAPAFVWVSASAFGGGSSPDGSRSTLAAAFADPLSLLAKRSPGHRSPGALLSSKPQRAGLAAAAPPPTQRILGRVRERPAAIPPLEGGAPVAAGDLVPLGAIPAQPGFASGGAPGIGGVPGFGGEPGSPFPGLPGGPGGGGPAGPTLPGSPDVPIVPVVPVTPVVVVPVVPVSPLTPPTTDLPVTPTTPVVPTGPGGPVTLPPTVSPVPEPASWVMMLFGFFALGCSMRRAGVRRAGRGPGQEASIA